MLDFTSFNSGQQSFAELVAPLTIADLRALTNEMIDTIHGLIADATDADVTFVPQDPAANDTFAASDEVVNLPWTLGHVIVHVTASSEESAALALNMARGLLIEGRSRVEVPWETVQTIAEVVARLEESRRMRLAMLDAWPAAAHLELSYTPYARIGAINAIGRFVLGLSHDNAHLGQIGDIMAQARAAHHS